MIFDELVRQLQAIPGVQFREYEWRTRPAGNFGTVQLDFEADVDYGDDHKRDRAWEGSVDLYTRGKEMMPDNRSLYGGVCSERSFAQILPCNPTYTTTSY